MKRYLDWITAMMDSDQGAIKEALSKSNKEILRLKAVIKVMADLMNQNGYPNSGHSQSVIFNLEVLLGDLEGHKEALRETLNENFFLKAAVRKYEPNDTEYAGQ
jgi:hypothetical protein